MQTHTEKSKALGQTQAHKHDYSRTLNGEGRMKLLMARWIDLATE